MIQVEVTRSRRPETGGSKDDWTEGTCCTGPGGLRLHGAWWAAVTGSYPELSGSPWVGWGGGRGGATCSCSSPEKLLPAHGALTRPCGSKSFGKGSLPSSEAVEAAVGATQAGPQAGHPGWTPRLDPRLDPRP